MIPKELETAIFAAVKDHGIVRDGWRIKITSVESNYSDWATVAVDVIRPRCRKPCCTWELAIWVPGMLLRWDKSKGYKR